MNNHCLKLFRNRIPSTSSLLFLTHRSRESYSSRITSPSFNSNMADLRRSSRLSSSSVPSPPVPPSLPKSNSKSKSVANTSKKRKAPAPSTTAAGSIDNDGFAIPSTPKRKRSVTNTKGTKAESESPSKVPETPTPAAASQMGIGISYSSGDIDDSTPPPSHRLANPLATNAPLFSPMTSRLVSQKPTSATNSELSPSKVRANEHETTTDNILEEALSHLIKVDPRLKAVIEKHPCRVFAKEGLMEVIDPFRSLVSGIISQQVSGAAAKSIKNKFIALFNTSSPADIETKPETSPAPPPTPTANFPTPLQVSQTPLETLRTAGLSQRKAEYIQGLASKFANGELTTEFLLNAPYEEVLEELVKVRGLGKWSVEMFACFGLKRMDVFSTGDLGVQRGMAALQGRDVSKLKAKGGGKWKYMSEKEMLDISSKFAPYRSVFMWYTWRIADTDVLSLESSSA